MENNIEELTLLLMYLNSWNEDGYVYNEKTKMPEKATLKRCWKGYDFNILNKLAEKGYLYSEKYKNKSVTLTKEGEKLAEELLTKYLKWDFIKNEISSEGEKEEVKEKEIELERYIIKKGKTDLLSSLKALNKKLLKEKLEEKALDDINELKEYIIDDFEMILDMTKDDIFTRMYFERLLENENSIFLSAYQSDIESLMVFVYKNGDHYSYYVPAEIKKIIKKLLKI